MKDRIRAALFLVSACLGLAGLVLGSGERACSITPYGVGLGGQNTGTLSSPSTPALGGLVALNLQDFTTMPTPGAGVVVITTGEAFLPILGGTLLVQPGTEVWRADVLYDVFAETFVRIPAAAQLAGISVYSQAALFFPQLGELRFSNGLRIAICS